MINWFFFVIYYHPRSQNTAPLAELHVSMTTDRGKNEVWYFILLDFKQIKVAMETHGLSCGRALLAVGAPCLPRVQRNDEDGNTCGILRAAGVDQGAAAVTLPVLTQRADLESSPFSTSDPSSRLPLPQLPSMHHHRVKSLRNVPAVCCSDSMGSFSS